MNKTIKIIAVLIFTFLLYSCDAFNPNISNTNEDIQTTEPSMTTENSTQAELDWSYQLNPGYDTILIGEAWEDPGLRITYKDTEYIIYSDTVIDTSNADYYQISYNYQNDDFSVQVFRYVSVIEVEDIEIQLNPGIDTIYKGQTWVDSGATINTGHTLLVDGSVNNQIPGLYEITYYVEDEYGIIAQITRFVRVLGADDLN